MERHTAPWGVQLSGWARRLARWTVGLALLPLGCLTAALFLTTSGVVPEHFTSWRDLGCKILVNQPGKSFSGITSCGYAYMTTDGPPDQTGRYQVQFHDSITGNVL